MSHFVGIDLHRNRSHLVAVDEAGERVFSRRVRNDPGRVLDALAELDDPRVAVEATYGWEWLIEFVLLHEVGRVSGSFCVGVWALVGAWR